MEGFTEKILDVLIALVIFFALLGVIITSTNGLNWSALNIGGTVTNLSWAPYIIVLVIVVGAVYLVYRYLLHKKK
jgi:TRAP-type C4-dicarboxylate transport system permease small subunit